MLMLQADARAFALRETACQMRAGSACHLLAAFS
jgi:hypothetical protein